MEKLAFWLIVLLGILSFVNATEIDEQSLPSPPSPSSFLSTLPSFPSPASYLESSTALLTASQAEIAARVNAGIENEETAQHIQQQQQQQQQQPQQQYQQYHQESEPVYIEQQGEATQYADVEGRDRMETEQEETAWQEEQQPYNENENEYEYERESEDRSAYPDSSSSAPPSVGASFTEHSSSTSSSAEHPIHEISHHHRHTTHRHHHHYRTHNRVELDDEPCYPKPCGRKPKVIAFKKEKPQSTVVQVPYPVPVYLNKLRVVKVKVPGPKPIVDNRKYLLKVEDPPPYASTKPGCNSTVIEADKRALLQTNLKIANRRKLLDRHDHWLLDAKRTIEIVQNEIQHTSNQKNLITNQIGSLLEIRRAWTNKLKQDELKYNIQQAEKTLMQLHDHKKVLTDHSADVARRAAQSANRIRKLQHHLQHLPANTLDDTELSKWEHPIKENLKKFKIPAYTTDPEPLTTI